ncbi:MAG: NADH-quinone oxidoreductase subunit A [Deltaproteobacteria bacterium]|nr:NADH-quinone oxidoreductase subunit A [Deltaproteobacteria bacterium]
MLDSLLSDYAYVLAFVSAGFLFALVPLGVAFLVSPKGVGLKKLVSYESGIEPKGQAWIQFEVTYYLYALIFLAFDVDVLYLFPVVVAFGSFPWRDLIEIAMFVGILSLALAYAWKKGVFQW